MKIGKRGNVMDYHRVFFIVLILFSLMYVGRAHAQVEEIPGAAQEIEEIMPEEPASAPPVEKSVDAYTSATEEIDKAALMYQELKANGHIILEGIYFDKGTANLDVKSDSCIMTIAEMLTDHPKMKVYIVSHTDNNGHMINQMRLSQQRSAAIMNSLTDRYSIKVERVFAGGVGPMCPLTTNETEEGRAKNNRIELVLQ